MLPAPFFPGHPQCTFLSRGIFLSWRLHRLGTSACAHCRTLAWYSRDGDIPGHGHTEPTLQCRWEAGRPSRQFSSLSVFLPLSPSLSLSLGVPGAPVPPEIVRHHPPHSSICPQTSPHLPSSPHPNNPHLRYPRSLAPVHRHPSLSSHLIVQPGVTCPTFPDPFPTLTLTMPPPVSESGDCVVVPTLCPATAAPGQPPCPFRSGALPLSQVPSQRQLNAWCLCLCHLPAWENVPISFML